MNRDPWLENLFRPLVVGVMFGCVALSVVELVCLIFPAWNATYLIVGCVLAALEANYSYRLIRARSLRGTDRLRFRVIELLIFFIALKVGGYIGDRWADVLADIQTWPRYPYNVIDLETTIAFILVLFSWHASTQTVCDLERLDEPPGRDRYYVPPIESLTSRFFWGGTVLLVAGGLTRIGIAQLLDLRRPSVPGLVLNVLVYFVLGLVMLGQVRFATLHKRWQSQGVKVSRGLAGRWVRYTLGFIGLAAFLAFLLPTGYTLGLLEVAGFALSLILGLLSIIALLFSLLILYPLGWLLSKLFGAESSPLQHRAPPPQLPPPGLGSAGPDWWEGLRSLLFWMIALGMVFYVIRGYLRDHPDLLETFGALGPIRGLRHLWSLLWGWLKGWAQVVGERIPRHLPRRLRQRKAKEPPFRLFRLGALSPREQVLYYYLSILRRAAGQGFARRPAQTPNEYQAAMEPRLPEAQQEMNLLTQAFVEARYSRHAVERDYARRVRANWQRVKAALRGFREKRDSDGPAGSDLETHRQEEAV